MSLSPTALKLARSVIQSVRWDMLTAECVDSFAEPMHSALTAGLAKYHSTDLTKEQVRELADIDAALAKLSEVLKSARMAAMLDYAKAQAAISAEWEAAIEAGPEAVLAVRALQTEAEASEAEALQSAEAEYSEAAESANATKAGLTNLKTTAAESAALLKLDASEAQATGKESAVSAAKNATGKLAGVLKAEVLPSRFSTRFVLDVESASLWQQPMESADGNDSSKLGACAAKSASALHTWCYVILQHSNAGADIPAGFEYASALYAQGKLSSAAKYSTRTGVESVDRADWPKHLPKAFLDSKNGKVVQESAESAEA